MYLRHTIRKKDGKVHRYWCVVRSVRVGRRVIQQVVAHLGELDERGRIQARELARHLIGTPEQAQLFDDGSEGLTVPVRLKGIRVERSLRFGDVYLGLALWRGTGLEDLCEQLLPVGKELIPWAKMAALLVTARLCEPSSELHIAEDWYRRTALADLLQLGDREVTKERLYRALDHLLEHKSALEAHLSKRCGELFATENEVLLYDVTSTYFEGQAERIRAITGRTASRYALPLSSPLMAFRWAMRYSPATRTTRAHCRPSSPRWKRGMECWGGFGLPTVAWRVPRISPGCGRPAAATSSARRSRN